MRSSILVGAAALSTAAVSANLPTIEAIGSKFFDKNGKQFFMKGTFANPLDNNA